MAKPDNNTPDRADLDRRLKRLSIARRRAQMLSPDATREARMLAGHAIKVQLQELRSARAIIRDRLNVVQNRRTAVQAYTRTASLRLVTR